MNDHGELGPERREGEEPDPPNEMDFDIARTIKDPPENRATAEGIWRDLAAGRVSQKDRDLWLTAVAERVVAYVLDTEDERNRGSQALIALFLAGRAIAHQRAGEDLELFDEFTNLDGSEPASRREAARMLQARGYLTDRTEAEAMKVIDRLRNRRE
jgi:hypothetical protein